MHRHSVTTSSNVTSNVPVWLNHLLDPITGNIASQPMVSSSSTSSSAGIMMHSPLIVNATAAGSTPQQTSVSSSSEGHSAEETSILLPNNKEFKIKDVWNHNVYREMKTISLLIKKYNYIAMDTEFPGVVAKPIGVFESTADYLYHLMKCNVDLLKIIQLGITLFDSEGNLPEGPYTTWQFNFKFSLTEDMYAQDSIDLLMNSHIQFRRHEEEGIDPFEFACFFIPSGLPYTHHVKWLTFHSSFDFGYLLKMLTNMPLPDAEKDFFNIFRHHFPKVYDIKYLMKSCKNLKGGLQEIADQLELKRVGPQHQAGSDSLLTGMAFFKIRDMYFEGIIDDAKYCGHLYGLGSNTNGVNNSTNGNNRFQENSETPTST